MATVVVTRAKTGQTETYVDNKISSVTTGSRESPKGYVQSNLPNVVATSGRLPSTGTSENRALRTGEIPAGTTFDLGAGSITITQKTETNYVRDVKNPDNIPLAYKGVDEYYKKQQQDKSFVSNNQPQNKAFNDLVSYKFITPNVNKNDISSEALSNKNPYVKSNQAIRQLSSYEVSNPIKKSSNNPVIMGINKISDLKSKTTDKFLEKAESNIQSYKDFYIKNRELNFKKNVVNINRGENPLNTFYKVSKSGIQNIRDLGNTEGRLAFAGLGSAGLTLASIPLRPIKSVESFYNMGRHPIKTGEKIIEDIKINPVGTLTEFYVTGKGLNEMIKPLKYTSPVEKIRRELFIKKQPIELQNITRAILESEKAQRGIVPVPIKNIKDVNFYDIKNLKPSEAKIFFKTIKDEKAIVFGSKSARVLSGGLTRLPKDIDLAVSNVKEFNKSFLENTPNYVKNEVNVRNQKIQRLSDKSTLADIKPLSRLRPDKSILTGKGSLPIAGYSNKLTFLAKNKPILSFDKKIVEGSFDIPTQRVKKVSGFKFVSFSEQTSRKALGSLQFILEKNIKRQKDLPDYISYLKIQEKALKKEKGSSNQFKSLNKLIKGLEKESKKVKVVSEKRIKVSSSKLPSSYLPSKIPYKSSILPKSYLPKSRIPSSSISKLSSSNISRIPSSSISKLSSSNIYNLSSISSLPSSIISNIKSSTSPNYSFSKLGNKKSFNDNKMIFNINSMFKRKKARKGKISSRLTMFTPTLIGSGRGIKGLAYIGGEAR